MPLPGQFLSIWDCPRIWSDILWLCPLGSWYNQQCVAQWWSPMHFDCRNGSSCYLFRFETGVHVWSWLNAANMHDVLCSLLANFVDLYFDFPISSFSDFWTFDLFVFFVFSKFLFLYWIDNICRFSAMCRIPVFAIFLKSVFSWLENSSLLVQSCVSTVL